MFGTGSTGWRTEALIIVGGLLLAAVLGDVAAMFNLPKTAEAAGTIGGLAALGFAVLAARFRAAAVKKEE